MTLCPSVSKFNDTISAVWPKSVCRHSPDSTSKTLADHRRAERRERGRGLNAEWRTARVLESIGEPGVIF